MAKPPNPWPLPAQNTSCTTTPAIETESEDGRMPRHIRCYYELDDKKITNKKLQVSYDLGDTWVDAGDIDEDSVINLKIKCPHCGGCYDWQD